VGCIGCQSVKERNKRTPTFLAPIDEYIISQACTNYKTVPTDYKVDTYTHVYVRAVFFFFLKKKGSFLFGQYKIELINNKSYELPNDSGTYVQNLGIPPFFFYT
jgi:hypothetical protein